MLDYLDQGNRDPKPFVWTASADLILGKVARLDYRSRGGRRKYFKRAKESFLFVVWPLKDAAPQSPSGAGCAFQCGFEKTFRFSSADSSTPADKGPARDSWKPSIPRPCAPLP